MLEFFESEPLLRKEIDRPLLTELFKSTLKTMTLENFVSLFTNEFLNIFEFSDLCNGKKAGNKISLLFNPHRLNTRGGTSNAIYESLQNDGFLSGLARACLFKKDAVKELLYQVLQLGINGVQYVNEFPPSVAQEMYLTSGVKNPKILDPCSGWGGRMIGAASIGGQYTGFEPCTETYKGLMKLGYWLKQFNTGFDFEIHNIPFEEAVLKEGYFDIALTSPPYYDTEKYSEEETNSLNRYKTYDEWVAGFYKPLIENTMKALKSNGCFILNIGDRKYPLSKSMKEIYPAEELKSKLSGAGGLGKVADGKEKFWILRKVNNV